MTIDPIPVLTDTGGGAQMAYFNGVSAISTEKLAGSWCGDLLQIVDYLPEGFKIIGCCFADIWRRADYCYRIFGLNDEGLIRDGDELYEAVQLGFKGNRGKLYNVKVEMTEDKIKFSVASVSEQDS
jgi:hypothetical protein